MAVLGFSAMSPGHEADPHSFCLAKVASTLRCLGEDNNLRNDFYDAGVYQSFSAGLTLGSGFLLLLLMVVYAAASGLFAKASQRFLLKRISPAFQPVCRVKFAHWLRFLEKRDPVFGF